MCLLSMYTHLFKKYLSAYKVQPEPGARDISCRVISQLRLLFRDTSLEQDPVINPSSSSPVLTLNYYRYSPIVLHQVSIFLPCCSHSLSGLWPRQQLIPIVSPFSYTYSCWPPVKKSICRIWIL